MPQRIKLKTGDVFGQLTVVKWDTSVKRYICVCSCGKEVLQRCWNLSAGKVKSCGCLSGKFTALTNHKPEFEAAKNTLFKKYSLHAVERNLQFNLDKETFIQLISGSCAYCGVNYSNEMRPPRAYKYVPSEPFKYNGIDRVDNSKGYELDNCVSCCDICNKAKRNLSKEEWVVWLKRLIEFQTKS